jgi:hypothetical protein
MTIWIIGRWTITALFAPRFRGDTWQRWRVFLKPLFALPFLSHAAVEPPLWWLRLLLRRLASLRLGLLPPLCFDTTTVVLRYNGSGCW